MHRIPIITTHPIQYNAPMFKMLRERGQITIRVFYTLSQFKDEVRDEGFGRTINWDIPLLEGYDHIFNENISFNPSTKHRKGIINPTLIREIEDWKPDSVLVYGWNFVSHFNVMKYFKGKIPVLFRGDSTLLDEKTGLRQIARRLYLRKVYRNIDYALYVGTRNKEYFKAHGLKEEQLIFAPHAVDNDRFFDSPEKKYEEQAGQWRRELEFRDDDLVILFAGKFEPKKDPILLLKAFQNVNQQSTIDNHPSPIKLLFVGNGQLETVLKTMAAGDPNVKFLPFQNQSKMPVVYRLGDIYCLPSKGPSETWGLAVNEAFACGKPSLVSDKTGCAVDLVKDSVNGYTFQAGSIEDLIRKINLFTDNKNRLKEMGETGLETIQEWNYEKVCQGIENCVTKNTPGAG